MAFGQPSGPPATAKQVKELLMLLQDAGHTDFRDARGPLGLTQRQAAGKFTRDEASAFIEQLQPSDFDGQDGSNGPDAEAGPNRATPIVARPIQRLTAADQALRRLTTEQLAAELQRRGWIVVEP